MVASIDNLAFNIPGLGRFNLEELNWRREYLAADVYGREKPAPLDFAKGGGGSA